MKFCLSIIQPMIVSVKKKKKKIEPITPTKKIKTVKPITPTKNIVSIPIESVSASITIPVESV